MADQLRHADVPGASPVREAVGAFLAEGDLYDNLLADGDPSTIPSAIGLQSLGIGFDHAEELIKRSSLTTLFQAANSDVVALEHTLFLTFRCCKSLEQVDPESGFFRFSSSKARSISIVHSLRGAHHFILGIYVKHYEPMSVEDYIDQARSSYMREEELPSSAFASRLLSIQANRSFVYSEPVPVETRSQMLMGVYAMTTFQKHLPAYEEELVRLLECFPGF